MFREVIIQIKEKTNLSYRDIVRKAKLPEVSLSHYLIGVNPYPVNKIEKIFVAFDVKYQLNEVSLTNIYGFNLYKKILIEKKTTLFQEILIEIKNKYKLTYSEILKEVGLPKTDRSLLNEFALGTRKYNIYKLEKIFARFGVEFILPDNYKKIFREVIIQIKENNHLSDSDIIRKANLPADNNISHYMLGTRSYPVSKIEKIFIAFNVKYQLNEVPITNIYRRKNSKHKLTETRLTLFREILIEIKNKYKLTYLSILKEAGLSLKGNSTLKEYIHGALSYPLYKLEKIFIYFGVEFTLSDNDSIDTNKKVSGEVEISN